MSHQQWSGVDCWRSVGDIACVVWRARQIVPTHLNLTSYREHVFVSAVLRVRSPPSPLAIRLPPLLVASPSVLAGPQTSGPHLPTSMSNPSRPWLDLSYSSRSSIQRHYLLLFTNTCSSGSAYLLTRHFPAFPFRLRRRRIWRICGECLRSQLMTRFSLRVVWFGTKMNLFLNLKENPPLKTYFIP